MVLRSALEIPASVGFGADDVGEVGAQVSSADEERWFPRGDRLDQSYLVGASWCCVWRQSVSGSEVVGESWGVIGFGLSELRQEVPWAIVVPFVLHR